MLRGRAHSDSRGKSEDKSISLCHTPILAAEIAGFLTEKEPELIIDGTAGGGGHLDYLLRVAGQTRFIAFDRDLSVTELLRARYENESRIQVIHGSYTDIPGKIREIGISPADGALFDFGLSSIQLDDPQRGFSYRFDGPLDMRFNRSGSDPTAMEILNTRSEREIADIIYRYGEERRSRAIARAIVRKRPLVSTEDLVGAVRGSIRGNPIKSLSRVFQALRICVNSELEHLTELLEHLHEWLCPGGRAAFLTFHSLEDRKVKHFLRDSDDFSPTSPPWIVPSDSEKQSNRRSRSARLRMGVRN